MVMMISADDGGVSRRFDGQLVEAEHDRDHDQVMAMAANAAAQSGSPASHAGRP